jgi:hypothetical protein
MIRHRPQSVVADVFHVGRAHVIVFMTHDDVACTLVLRCVGNSPVRVPQDIETEPDAAVDLEFVQQLFQLVVEGTGIFAFTQLSLYLVMKHRPACSGFLGLGRLASASRSAATVSGLRGQRRGILPP